VKLVTKFFLISLITGIALTGNVFAAKRFIVAVSTTSTVNSGLFDYLLSKFTRKHGIQIRVVGVGTGQAIRIARRGNADVLFVHHKKSELAFVRDGFGIGRSAKVGQTKSVKSAYKAIANSKSIFTSRGDDSGTHKKSLSIWQVTIKVTHSNGGAKWYRETGSGMGTTLNIASSMNAYTLTDRVTWENYKNKEELKILFEHDPLLQNQYGIIKVNPARHKHVKSKEVDTFINWILYTEGQAATNNYRFNNKRVFFANAKK